MNFDSIPDELKAYPQFVVWKYEDRDGHKRAKVPYSPLTFRRASVDDAATWSTYNDAVNNCADFSGIGFVLTGNDPYTFIDLDDYEGDDDVLKKQQFLVTTFDSYTELSPSTKGVHVIVKGTVSAGRRRGKFEIYSSSRFMTMTGNVYLDKPVRESQALIDTLWTEMGGASPAGNQSYIDSPQTSNDQELIARAVNAKNSEKFISLVQGQWLNVYPSQSEADFALINMLCFYSSNDEQVRRMFRDSELGKRDKAKRDEYLDGMILRIRGEKLRDPDISEIVKNFGRFPPGPKPSSTTTGAELLARTFAPIRWAIHELIPQGVTLLIGAPKLGKSWLCLQVGIAISGAVPLWNARAAEAQGEVLALCLEDNDRRLHDRLSRLLPSMMQSELMGDMRTPSVDRLHFATEWPRADQGGVAKLDEWLTARPETRLVLIDTLARFRATDDARLPPYQRDTNAIAELQALANRHGCAIVLVHHTRKDNTGDALDSISGTNGLAGAADASLILSRVRGQSDASLFLTGRDVQENTIALRFDQRSCTWSCTDVTEASSLTVERQKTVEAIRKHGSCGSKELAIELGITEPVVRVRLTRMIDAGIIVKTARGVYSLPSLISP